MYTLVLPFIVIVVVIIIVFFFKLLPCFDVRALLGFRTVPPPRGRVHVYRVFNSNGKAHNVSCRRSDRSVGESCDSSEYRRVLSATRPVCPSVE